MPYLALKTFTGTLGFTAKATYLDAAQAMAGLSHLIRFGDSAAQDDAGSLTFANRGAVSFVDSGLSGLTKAARFNGDGDGIGVTGLTSAARAYSAIAVVRSTVALHATNFILDIETGRWPLIWQNVYGYVDGANNVSTSSLVKTPKDGYWHQLVWAVAPDGTGSFWLDGGPRYSLPWAPVDWGGRVAIGTRYNEHAFANYDFAGDIAMIALAEQVWTAEQVAALNRHADYEATTGYLVLGTAT